jgi:uncharacterized membrane protein YraQ (UPF0718 family)
MALAALLVGPLLAMFWSRGRAWRAVIDGLSLALVGGICFLIAFPHAVEEAGPVGIAAAVLGSLVPGWSHRLGARWDRTFRYAGLVMLALHAAIDGAALVLPGSTMGVAVVAHRLPMGLAVYSAASRASGGARSGFAAVGVLVAATLVGFFAGEPLSGVGGPIGHGAFEGFVAGVLLHIVFEHAPVFPAPEHPDLLGHGHHHGGHDHGHHHESSAREAARAGGSRWSAVGALAGMLIVLGLLVSGDHTDHHHASPSFLDILLDLTLASAPALVLGYAAATAWVAIVPRGSSAPPAPASPLARAGAALWFGVRERLCACGVVPAARGLVDAGRPPSSVAAFLLATPALGVGGLVVSGLLLGPSLTAVRAVAAVLMAVLVIFVVRTESPSAVSLAPTPRPASPHRLRAAAQYGFGELVDHTLPWVALGIIAAGIGVLALPWLGAGSWPSFLQVPLLALLGVPLYICATGATPAAVALAEHGLSSGAVMALLVAGPALNLPALALLRSVFGTVVTRRIAGVVLLVATFAGWGVDILGWSPPSVAAATAASTVVVAAVLALGALAMLSMLRQGARGVVAQIVEPIEVRTVPPPESVTHHHHHHHERGS